MTILRIWRTHPSPFKETPTLLQSLQRTVNVTLGEGHGGDRREQSKEAFEVYCILKEFWSWFCFDCSGEYLHILQTL